MIKNLKIKIVLLALIFTAGLSVNAQFTPGNFVVERLGDSTYNGGNSSSTPIWLMEYTTSGNLVQQMEMPIIASGSNNPLTESGSASKSALMSLSVNGQYLCVTGYDDTVGDGNVTTSNANIIPREVGTVDYNGTINTTTLIMDSYSGAKIRGVASVDGTQFWTSGNSGGVRYLPLGCTGNTTATTTAPTNENALGIFNGQLYCTADHNPIGLDSVGRGLPTTSLGYPAVPLHADVNSTSGFEFQWLVLSAGDTICYIANQQSGGLVKYSWRNDSLIKCGALAGTFIGLTASVKCDGNVLLIYDNSAATSNPVFKFIDSSGYLGTMHTATGNPATLIAGNNIAFNKGIAFSPYQDLSITGTQNLTAGSYHDIVVGSGGVATLTGNIKMVGTLTVQSGGTLICNGYNVLGNSDFQNAFVLNSGGTLKIGSAAGITASAASGNIQTCARVYSIAGNYVYNGTANQVAGNGLPSTIGSLTIANTGSNGNNTVTLTASVSVANDLTITSGILDVSTNNYAINVAGSFYNNASFTCRTGTVTFNGSGAENFLPSSSNFYNVVVNNSGSNSVTLQSALTIINNITISGGTLDASTSNYGITVTGNFTNNSTFTARNGTVTFNGSGSESFTPGSSNYYNIVLNNASGGSVTLAGNLNSTHDITITTGTLDVSSSNYSITVAGSFYNYATFNAEYGPLTFNGTSAENFLPGSSSYYAVVINNSGNNSVTLQSDLNVTNNLTITSGTLNVSTSNYAINDAGNFTNNANFSAHTGTLTFNGGGADSFYPGNSSFYNVVINNSGTGSVTLAHSLTVSNNLTITAGTFNVSASSYLVSISGSLYNYSNFNAHTGTVYFIGSNGEEFYAGTSNFYNVEVDNNGNGYVNLTSNATINGNLTINSGVLDANTGNYSLTVAGDFNNYSQFNAEAGTLTVAGNFYDEWLFLAQSGSVILNGSGMQYLDDAYGDIFNNITINNSGGDVYLTNYLYLNGVLNCLNGGLFLNGLVLASYNTSPSAIIRTNGYIVSESYYTIGSSPDVQVDNSTLSYIYWDVNTSTGTFIFPFGTSSGQYIPYAIQNNAGNDLGTVSVATWNAPYNSLNTGTLGPLPQTVPFLNNMNGDNSDNTVKRFWQLYKSGSDIVASMTFTCPNTEAMNNANTSYLTNLSPQRWNGSDWDHPLNAGSPLFTIPNGDASATVINIPNFSPWTLTAGGAPLPIELLTFGAEYLKEANAVRVNWQTVSEINNDYFTIERTADGQLFNDIGKVDGSHNSNTTLNYSFDDTHPLTGMSYYRLKQTDFDGKFSYSKLAPIEINANGVNASNSINMYPDPSDNSTLLSFNGTEETATIEISDARGAMINSSTIQTISGGNLLTINTRSLPDGIYFIKIKSSSSYKVQKLCVKH